MARTFWVVVHRWTGLALAFFLSVAGLTGSLLAFYEELDARLNPTLLTVSNRAGEPLGPDVLARLAEAAIPNSVVTGLRFPGAPGQSVGLSIEGIVNSDTGADYDLGLNEVYLDPLDGRFLGARELGEFGLDPPRIMSLVYSIHYSLHLPGTWGWWVMGIAAIVWFLDNFVGAYLTFPVRRAFDPARPPQVAAKLARGWRSRWKPAWLIRMSGSSFRLTFDLHRAIGLWVWLLLGMFALTSVYLNLPREVFNPIVNLFATVVPEPEEFPGAVPNQRRLTFSDALAVGRKNLPYGSEDLQPRFVSYERESGVFRVDFGFPNARNEWFRIRHETVFLDAVSGAVVGRWGTQSGGAGDRFNAVLFPLHSGQLLALPGRILICITGILIVVISATGVLIWLKKRRAHVEARRRRTG